LLVLREIDRHLQDLAAILGLNAAHLLVGQKFADHSQGFHFFLQALQFGFFPAKHFQWISHGSPVKTRIPPRL
jgi:hypothetical protein